MSNRDERRALALKAVEVWKNLGECIADRNPWVAGLKVIEQFMNTSSSADWGQGAWQCYSELTGLRDAAWIMGFRLSIEDLQALTDNPRHPLYMLPKNN